MGLQYQDVGVLVKRNNGAEEFRVGNLEFGIGYFGGDCRGFGPRNDGRGVGIWNWELRMKNEEGCEEDG